MLQYFVSTVMNHILTSLLVASLVLPAWTQNRKTCKEAVASNIESPCSYLRHSRNVVTACTSSVGGNIMERSLCEKNSSCCWEEDESVTPCFYKPQKCYVDLRREKCFSSRLQSHPGVSGIFTGYSTNGTYCDVPVLNHLSKDLKQRLGVVDGHGYPITNYAEDLNSAPCREHWEIKVTKTSSDLCSITVYNRTDKFQTSNKESEIRGELRFGKYCIFKCNENSCLFDYSNEEVKHDQCICRINSWIASDDESLPVSEEIKEYIKHLENFTLTCNQIVGVFVRSSWLRVLSLTNREEAQQIMDTLVMLTNSSKQLTTSDINVFLRNANKVAQYNFYEGFEKTSAKDIIEKTAFMASNIIEALTEEKKRNVRLAASHSGETDDVQSFPNNGFSVVNPGSDLKHDLFQVMDSMSSRIASRINQESNKSEILFNIKEKNVDLSMAVVKTSKNRSLDQPLHFNKSSKPGKEEITVLKLPEENQTENEKDKIAVTSVFYNYPASSQDPSKRISNYLTVNVWSVGTSSQVTDLSVPVKFTLARYKNNYSENKKYLPVCSFLTSNSSNETWSQFGCITKSDENATTCECNHTTNFAILMKLTDDELAGGHNEALKIISTTLGLISITCLSGTVFVFLNYRKTLLRDRMIIHFHLVVALLFAYIFMLPTSLLASPRDSIPSLACIACAVFIHFFYLAVYFWSLVEGIYLFCKIVFVYSRKSAERVQRISPLIGWLIPFIIVVISFTLSYTVLLDDDQNVYTNPTTCFLSVKSGMIWAYFGPVIFIVGINLIVLIKISIVVFKSTYSSNRLASATKTAKISTSLKKSFRGAAILMPILSVPTIAAVLYNLYEGKNPESLGDTVRQVFGAMGAYLQVMLAGAQGIAIFFFYCLYNDEVRDARKLATHRRKSMGSLDTSGGKRKQSRLPLLFGRSEASYDTNTSLDQTKNQKKNSTTEINDTLKKTISPTHIHKRRIDYQNHFVSPKLGSKENQSFSMSTEC